MGNPELGQEALRALRSIGENLCLARGGEERGLLRGIEEVKKVIENLQPELTEPEIDITGETSNLKSP